MYLITTRLDCFHASYKDIYSTSETEDDLQNAIIKTKTYKIAFTHSNQQTNWLANEC